MYMLYVMYCQHNWLRLIHLKSVKLAVKRNGEHEDAENDADGVEDAKLRDQSPERDLQA